jgi:outer membrane receptor protein involved in Fe transport
VAALYHVNNRVSVWGSVGAGFRAPTLNELYRQFRVGTVLTLANNQLGPERLVGGEAGVRFEPVRGVTVRSTLFDNRITDPVSNVTIGMSGNTVTQQRQNLGRTRVWGVQNDVEFRLGRSWRVTAGYLYNHARVTANDEETDLVGKYLPQVPTHRGSFEVAYSNPRWLDVAVDVQALGSQFDDDLNSRTVPGYSSPGLPKYAVVSFRASRSLGRNLELFVGAQNLFDQTYFVGTLPTTIGSPRLVNAGVRVRIGGN